VRRVPVARLDDLAPGTMLMVQVDGTGGYVLRRADEVEHARVERVRVRPSRERRSDERPRLGLDAERLQAPHCGLEQHAAVGAAGGVEPLRIVQRASHHERLLDDLVDGELACSARVYGHVVSPW
jgi:hypothetical protein